MPKCLWYLFTGMLTSHSWNVRNHALSMKFVQINLRLLTIANSFLQNIAEHENFSANEYENANYCWHFHIY